MNAVAISPISTLPLLTPSLQSASGASGGNTTAGSVGDQLLAAVAASEAASATAGDPLLQSLVTLGSGSGLPDASALTYNAQGLLNAVESATLLNDPLLQSTDPSGAPNLATLPEPASSADATSSATAAANASAATATPDLNAAWAQVLQKDPALAPTLTQSEMDQGIIDALL